MGSKEFLYMKESINYMDLSQSYGTKKLSLYYNISKNVRV